MKIDYVRKKNFRKEDRVKAVLKERGTHPGLVWIFSALEPCTSSRPWHDKISGRTYLHYDDGKAGTAIEDWAAAQQLADSWEPSCLHRKLNEFAQRYGPI